MSKVIMIGCDLHDVTLVLKVADGAGPSLRKGFLTVRRAEMIAWIREYADLRGAKRVVLAYEASGQGFGLYDDLTDAGIECHVLAPTHLPHTAHGRKNKTDDKDAEMLLDEVRAHVLAGRKLPTVWVPNLETRDDREILRQRLELAAQRTRIKNQIRNLFKRWKAGFPDWFSASGEWSRKSIQWLRDAAAGTTVPLGEGTRVRLTSLVNLYEALSTQLKTLDKAIARLSHSPRYAKAFRKLKLIKGVGTLCAMVFLTEMGDLNRFKNRRQLGAYLGLAPSAHESGQQNDRKGHITHQGPARVRHLLCQSAWVALRCSPEWREKYDRIRRNSKQRSKVAIVAIMRQLGVTMWHSACSAELDEVLEEVDQIKTSTRARQKGAAPPALPSPRPSFSEAEATATRKGLA